jgi:uncharacterized protein (DUF1015 family)
MMADVRGFPGLHYNPAKINNLADVISPPYDVISPEHRTEYLRKNSWNIVHLTLPEGQDPYENARKLFEQWLAEEVLVQDQESSMYYYHQTFQTPEGGSKTRKGFFTIVRIENFEKKIVLPHEATLFAPKEDRLNLLRATRANLEPILSLYSDPEQRIDALLEPLTDAPPRSKVEDEFGNSHSIWAIKDPAMISELQELMKENWVLIADGHHRYESCLMYRDEMGKENQDPEAPFHFMLMMLANIHQPGIHVLPYNRGIKNLPKFEPRDVLKKAGNFFDIHEFEEQDQARLALKKEGSETTAFLALLQNQRSYYLFRLKPHAKIAQFYPANTTNVVQRLDVNILHKVFIQGILSISEEEIQNQKYLKYYKDTKEEMKDFEAGRLQIAFFLNPTRVDQVVEVSRAGEKMPQKSTFFYPKLMSGFVLYKH